jgi:hypothetical protein
LILATRSIPKHPGRWECKLRLGAVAPTGLTLFDLQDRDPELSFGGRWNAGSNKYGHGGQLPGHRAFSRAVRVGVGSPAGASPGIDNSCLIAIWCEGGITAVTNPVTGACSTVPVKLIPASKHTRNRASRAAGASWDGNALMECSSRSLCDSDGWRHLL